MSPEEPRPALVRVAKRRNPLGLLLAVVAALLAATALVEGHLAAAATLALVAWAFTLVREDAER